MAPALLHYHMTLELKGFVTNFANFCIFSNICFCVDVFNMYCSLSLSWRTQRISLDGYVVSVFSRLWYCTVSSVLQIREAFFHYLCVYLTWICIFSLILELIFFFSWIYTPKFAYLMNISASLSYSSCLLTILSLDHLNIIVLLPTFMSSLHSQNKMATMNNNTNNNSSI